MRRRAAKITIRTTAPSTTRSSSIWTEVTSRARAVTGTMSPNPTVAKTVTVNKSQPLWSSCWEKLPTAVAASER